MFEQIVPEPVLAYYSRAADFPLGELPSGKITVVESPQRNLPGSRTVLYACRLHDRALVSVSPVLFGEINACCLSFTAPSRISGDDLQEQWQRLVQCKYGDRVCKYRGVKLYCEATGFHPIEDNQVCRITPENAGDFIEALQNVGIPDNVSYLLADNAAFAYCIDGQAVAFAGTHPVGTLSDLIGNVMVGTLEAYRRRGYGKAVVSATTAALLAQRRIAVYGTDTENDASINTAISVGYRMACHVIEIRMAE